MDKKAKPNFLIVGAAKSGTTSLFHYLNQHPDIYIPEVKECRFFSQLPKNFNGLGAEFFPNSGITDAKEYFGLFEGYESQVCGDISNDYLYYHEESIVNIKKYLGDGVKILIILRNPIDRAYSNYMHAIRDDWENLTFEESIIQESSRIKENWGWPYHYVKTGFYYNQVKAYVDNFKNIKIYLYDELKDSENFIDSIFKFLNVKKINIENKKEIFNASGYPKNKIIHKLINNDSALKRLIKPIAKKILNRNSLKIIKNNNLKRMPLNLKTRQYLQGVYIEDIEKLSNLIDRDLTNWIKDEL
jgi:hypothetical protein